MALARHLCLRVADKADARAMVQAALLALVGFILCGQRRAIQATLAHQHEERKESNLQLGSPPPPPIMSAGGQLSSLLSKPRHACRSMPKTLACCLDMQVPTQSPEEQRQFCLFLYRLSHTSKVRGCVLCATTP